MQHERWQRMQVLFEAAVTRHPSERLAFLTAEEPDASLRDEVMALLAADDGEDAVDELVQRAASRVDDDAPVSGRLVGPWRLLDELGAGGMGTVFRAERGDGAYERTVAIKFLRGIPTRDGAERMRRERQMLADLDHPYIAGLLDGGTTDEGQPYLVMDHVDGVEITQFARHIGIPERLRLIQNVARALHFAHRQLIVHRDLKPANVLVRSDGTPVLLDFGIAKLVDPDGDEAAGRTQAWFTPGYASPEQRRGEAVSTASDIYSMGQLMAEVLSGQYRAPEPDGRIVPPSARGLSGLPRRRRRELDAIVEQASAPRAADRYQSADAMADDIDRYFRHKPLRAAPARPLYLVSKFLRRNRYAVAAGVVFLFAVAAFTWRLATERDRALRAEVEAQAQSATAQSVVDYLISLFEAASPEQAGNRPIKPADLVDRGRERIDEQLAGQPLQQARMLGVLGRIDTELGRAEIAVESFRKAIEIERRQGDRLRLGEYLAAAGVLENQNERPASAIPLFEEAAAIFREHADSGERLADALGGLSLAQLRNGAGEEARATAAEALRIAEQTSGPRSELAANALQVVAEADSRTGHGEAAIGAAARALAVLRELFPPEHHTISTAIGFLANTYVQMDRYAESEPLFREMLKLRLETLDAGSAWVVTARNNLAQAIYYQGRILEALPLMQENVDLLRARGEDDTPSYLIALSNVASLHELTGNYDESIRQFEETYAIANAYPDAEADPRLGMYSQNLGRSLMLSGRLDEARPFIDAEIPGGDSDVRTVVIEQGRRLLHRAEWLRRSGRLDEVESQLDEAQRVFATVLPEDHPRMGAVLRSRGLLALDEGRLADAAERLREGLAIIENAFGQDSNVAIETRLQLADVEIRLGRMAIARDLVAVSEPSVKALFHPKSTIHAELRRLHRALGTVAG